MDKNSHRNDLFTRLFALVIFIIICLLYNNYRASVEYQKELQKKKDKEMSMETTSGYHGSNHGPSGWYWDIIDNMEERSQRAGYSSSSTSGKTSDSKRYSREDDLEERAWEYMEAEGLDYDSAYEAAEED